MEKGNTGVYKFFSKVLSMISKEMNSTAGKVNLISDVILAAVIITYLLTNTVATVSRIICSIFNPDITKYTSDSSIIIMLLILVAFFIVCLFFIQYCDLDNNKDKHMEYSSKTK